MTSGESGAGRLVDRLCDEWEARVGAADRRDAERTLAELYEQRGWGRPKAVVWLDSPLAGAIAARTLLYGHERLDRVRHPDAYESWVAAATARLEGAYGVFDKEPSAFEENESFAPRWQLPDVYSAYRLGYHPDDPNVQAVLQRVGEPAWAVNAVDARFKEAALSPADPGFFADVSARAHERLVRELRPVFPAEQWEAVRAVLQSCADAPSPKNWKRWRQVWAAVRAPENHAALILSAALGEDGVPRNGQVDPALLRLAAVVGWWWPFNDIALLTPHPEFHTDASGRLHREDGPAVRYTDGFEHHCRRGQPVPSGLVDPRWSAADIVHASDEELQQRAVREFGAASYEATLSAGSVGPDLRRAALDRLGWARFAAEAPLARVAGPVPDPDDPACDLTLHDVPATVLGRAVRVVVRSGGARDGSAVLVPADATDPVAAAGWLGGGAREPAPPPELLTRIRESEDLQDVLAGLDFEMSRDEHVEAVHLYCGAPLYPIGGHGTGGTYFLCGDGPRRPLLYADSEGGYQVLGRDLAEGLQFMVSAAPNGDPEADTEAAEALGLRPLSTEEYRSRVRQAEAMAGALTLVMLDENNAYEYRPRTWFRC